MQPTKQERESGLRDHGKIEARPATKERLTGLLHENSSVACSALYDVLEGIIEMLPDDPQEPAPQLQPSPVQTSTTLDRIALQNAEFNTLTELCRRWSTLQRVSVVDDEYPEVRHYYESAMRTFLEAAKANGR